MAGEVKKIIAELIDKLSSNEELSVKSVTEQYPFDEKDILLTFKEFEKNKIGVLAVGRKGYETRFIKGARRISLNIDKDQMESFKNDILNSGKTCFYAKDAPENPKNDNYIADCDVKYFGGKYNICIEAMKLLQDEGIGKYKVGRRGEKTRFVTGNDDVSNTKTFILANDDSLSIQNIPKQQDYKYNVVNNLLIKTFNAGSGYLTVEEALKNANITDPMDYMEIQKEIDNLGFYKLP